MKILFSAIFAAMLLLESVNCACNRKSGIVVRYNDKIEFCEENSPFRAELSNFQKPNSVGNPFITFNDRKNAKSSFYTVLMLDPDAPSPRKPFLKDYLHFGAVNIRKDQLRKGIHANPSENYDVFMEYMPPQPPRGSGVHRYNVIVLDQANKLHLTDSFQRVKFNLNSFMKTHRLTEADKATLITENRG